MMDDDEDDDGGVLFDDFAAMAQAKHMGTGKTRPMGIDELDGPPRFQD